MRALVPPTAPRARSSCPRWARIALSFAVSALGSATIAAPAQAAPERVVHVLEITADFDDVGLAQTLTNLLRLRIGDGADFLLASNNPSFLVLAPTVRCDARGFDARPLRESADASIDGRCLRSIGAHLGAKRYFWGHLYHEGGGRLGVKLHLWREDRGDIVKALALEGGGRERLIERLYAHLVHSEQVADVRVVASAALEGELWADERPQGAYTPGATLTLVAGEHRVEVRGGGKVLARGRATVVAGRASEIRLEVPARTDLPTEGPRPLPVTITPRGAWERPAGFVGLGVGAALIGAGIVSSLRVRALDDEFGSPPLLAYRSDVAGDACDAAESGLASTQAGSATPGRVERLCSGGATLRALQYVFYGAGALAAGVGAYLVLTSPGSRQASARTMGPRETAARWSLRPWAGPGAGGVSLGSGF